MSDLRSVWISFLVLIVCMLFLFGLYEQIYFYASCTVSSFESYHYYCVFYYRYCICGWYSLFIIWFIVITLYWVFVYVCLIQNSIGMGFAPSWEQCSSMVVVDVMSQYLVFTVSIVTDSHVQRPAPGQLAVAVLHSGMVLFLWGCHQYRVWTLTHKLQYYCPRKSKICWIWGGVGGGGGEFLKFLCGIRHTGMNTKDCLRKYKFSVKDM